jgi:hypothetical protein
VALEVPAVVRGAAAKKAEAPPPTKSAIVTAQKRGSGDSRGGKPLASAK